MLITVFIGIAVAVVAGVMVLAAYIAKIFGGSPIKWALLALPALFALIVWDYYPTRWAHQYYCEKEAGFWIYKTFDQWVRENPGVIETLVRIKGVSSQGERFDNGRGHTTTYRLNARFSWVVTQQDISMFLPIIRSEEQVKDMQRNEVLARYIDFGTGNSVKHTVGPPGPLKFWLTSFNCPGGQDNKSDIRQFESNFRGIEK